VQQQRRQDRGRLYRTCPLMSPNYERGWKHLDLGGRPVHVRKVAISLVIIQFYGRSRKRYFFRVIGTSDGCGASSRRGCGRTKSNHASGVITVLLHRCAHREGTRRITRNSGSISGTLPGEDERRAPGSGFFPFVAGARAATRGVLFLRAGVFLSLRRWAPLTRQWRA
jgi:hypothetical protein